MRGQWLLIVWLSSILLFLYGAGDVSLLERPVSVGRPGIEGRGPETCLFLGSIRDRLVREIEYTPILLTGRCSGGLVASLS